MASALVWGSIVALLADTTIGNVWPQPSSHGSQDATLCSDYSGGCPTGASPIAAAATFVGGDACACCTTIAALARVSAGPECACTIDCNSASGDEAGFADCCCSSGPMWSGSVRGAFYDVCVYGHTLSGVERPGPCCSDAAAPSISAVQASCPTQVTACACEEELTNAFATATLPADAGPSPELEEIFRCLHCSYIDCDTSSGDEMEYSDCCMQGNWHWASPGPPVCNPACQDGTICCSDGQTCVEFVSECPSPCNPACADGQWCCPNGQCAADAAACGQVG